MGEGRVEVGVVRVVFVNGFGEVGKFGWGLFGGVGVGVSDGVGVGVLGVRGEGFGGLGGGLWVTVEGSREVFGVV